MKKSISGLLVVFFITGFAASQNRTPPNEEALVIQHADMPLYPGMAKVARISGTVRVKVTVKDGDVVNTEVLQSSAPILANATTDNLKTWKFPPKANAKFITTYIYLLEKKEAELPENPRIQMQLPNLVKITVRPTKPTCMDCGMPKWRPVANTSANSDPLVSATKPSCSNTCGICLTLITCFLRREQRC